MTPFDAFRLYLALKQHFTVPSSDYFKYNGKVRVSQTTFEARRDKYMFYKLSKKDDILDYLIANLSEDPNMWVGLLFQVECEKRYLEYKKRKESLTYIFTNDIEHMLENFDDNFVISNGEYPHLLKLLVKKKISRESFIIINDCVGFFGSWNKKIIDPILWPTISMGCRKLYPFMTFEKDKYCALLRDKFS
jgi:hypothetical protein